MILDRYLWGEVERISPEAPVPIIKEGRSTVVLGDRNPLIDAYESRERLPDTTISFNHGGRGQWVLGSDGRTIWLERPVIGRSDNIWLPRGMSELRKGATPMEVGDAFLIH